MMSCCHTPAQDPAQAVLDNIATRTSIRHYTDERLTDAEIEPVERDNLNWPIDCSAACENILLAAHAMGLGGVWTACYPYPERYEVVKEVLGIPEKVMPLAVLPIGHPAEAPAPKDKWKPEKVHTGRW